MEWRDLLCPALLTMALDLVFWRGFIASDDLGYYQAPAEELPRTGTTPPPAES